MGTLPTFCRRLVAVIAIYAADPCAALSCKVLWASFQLRGLSADQALAKAVGKSPELKNLQPEALAKRTAQLAAILAKIKTNETPTETAENFIPNENAIKEMVAIGLKESYARRIVSKIAGDRTLRQRTVRCFARMEYNFQEVFRKSLAALVLQGISPKLAYFFASTAALILVTPISITNALALAGALPKWVLPLPFGWGEFFALYFLPLYGAKSINKLQDLAKTIWPASPQILTRPGEAMLQGHRLFQPTEALPFTMGLLRATKSLGDARMKIAFCFVLALGSVHARGEAINVRALIDQATARTRQLDEATITRLNTILIGSPPE